MNANSVPGKKFATIDDLAELTKKNQIRSR